MDDNKEYPYNIEFGDGRTKEEMDKMQDELMGEMLNGKVCPGCNGVFVPSVVILHGGCCSPECHSYMIETFG